jgi:hypothetical protein
VSDKDDKEEVTDAEAEDEKSESEGESSENGDSDSDVGEDSDSVAEESADDEDDSDEANAEEEASADDEDDSDEADAEEASADDEDDSEDADAEVEADDEDDSDEADAEEASADDEDDSDEADAEEASADDEDDSDEADAEEASADDEDDSAEADAEEASADDEDDSDEADAEEASADDEDDSEDADADDSEEADEDDSEEADAEEEASADDEDDSEDADAEDDADDEDDSEDADAEEEASADDEAEREETYQESVDRRSSGRKGVKLSRLISSKIIDGDTERECYLHLVDISDGGLRINSDDPFPEDRDFVLEVGLAPFGNELATKSPVQAFPVKVVWTKSLVGGMVVSGLAFQNLDENGQEIVEAIMQGASPQGRRMHFRLNRVLGVELGKDDEDQQWLYPLTLDLSVEGMRICLNDPLEVGSKFPIKVFLEFELPTVKANAEVMWQETMPSGRVQVGLKFEDMSERDAMAIKTYIDQCLTQDEAHRRL